MRKRNDYDDLKNILILIAVPNGVWLLLFSWGLFYRVRHNLKTDILLLIVLGLAVVFGITLCLYFIILFVEKTGNWLALRQCQKGNHTWNGCICTTCGATNHTWDGCKCTKCGETRDEGHSWDVCYCTRCGKTRNEGHSWDGCVCTRCGETNHTWELVESEIADDEYSYESGNQFLISYGYTKHTYRCNKCGKMRYEEYHHES